MFSTCNPTATTGAGLMIALGVGVVTVQATIALLILPGNLERQACDSLQAEEDTLSNSLQWCRYMLTHQACLTRGPQATWLRMSLNAAQHHTLRFFCRRSF